MADDSNISESDSRTLERFATQSRQAGERSEVISTVPPVVARGAAYGIAAAVLITLALLFFGKVHVVVTAKGNIVPQGNLIVVQALQAGVVTSVLARPGDQLTAGAPILKLDVSETGTTLAQTLRQRDLSQEQIANLRASLAAVRAALANPGQASLQGTAGIGGNAVQTIANLQNAGMKLEAARQELSRAPQRRKLQGNEIQLTHENIRLNERNYQMERKSIVNEEELLAQKAEQLKKYRQLAEKKLLSAFELGGQEEKFRADSRNVLSIRQKLDQQAIDISNQKLRVADLEAKQESEQRDREKNFQLCQTDYQQAIAGLRKEELGLIAQLREAESGLADMIEKIRLAEGRVRLTTIASPVTGTLSDLKLNNPGEMVTAGMVVANVTPKGAPLVVEALVENKDVGFLRPGLEARVKVDAYPYEQFGVARARVENVLANVGKDSNFRLRLALLQDQLGEGAWLFPGLTVQADILTRKQRLLKLLFESGAKKKE
jgi:hemolysin D